MNYYFDVTLDDYPRLAGEKSDDARIMRAVNDCGRGVLFFPKGVYEIANMLTVTNACSFFMHKSAVLKAVKEMPFVLWYDAASSYPQIKVENWCITPGDDYDSEDWNLFISGGVLDGAGLAGCLCLNSFKHFTLRDISLRNGKKYGLFIEDEKSEWTFELVAQNVYAKCTMPGLAGNVGIASRGGDSHFTDCIVVDYTTGFELIGGGSNRLTRCHVWGGPLPPENGEEIPQMLKNSVNFRISSGDALLTDCYADTGETGYLITETTRLIGCSYFNNYGYGLDGITAIDHRGGQLLVADGVFRKTCPNAVLYKGTGEKVIFRDNLFEGEWQNNPAKS
ncbi:MAG: hypothetical protein K5879_01445 [Lachnospiraceae bacterium]|nr:hypothetical protein [Lachnospiraceae bacterium]